MNYLVYIEHTAENLQFFLWYRDYCKRFEDLPMNEKALSLWWNAEQPELEAQNNPAGQGAKQPIGEDAAAVFKGTDFAAPVTGVVEVKSNPFTTPPRTPVGDRESGTPLEPAWSDNASTLNGSSGTEKSHHKKAAGAFEAADVKFQPCEKLALCYGQNRY